MRAQLLLCVGCVSLLALLHACAAAPAEHNRVTFPKTQQESGTGGDIAVVTVAEHHAVWRALLYRAALPEPKQNARARRHANPEDETFTAVWKSLSDLIMRVVNLGPDPSLVYRPDLPPTDSKDKSEFRNFESGELFDRVFNTYQQMHTHQTLDFVKRKHVEWTGCTHARMSVMEGVSALDQLVDESDPDADFPNSFHAFQTAEGIRQEHPDKDWFQLVGLIHDIGKILALWGEPQWAVVGDTFPVGCKFQNSIVFRDSTFVENPDDKSPTLNSESGIYQPHCGLDNVLMSWGHDEYLYRVMKFNKCLIPEEGLYMIRFHSFYPWHCHGDYMHLCNEKDLRMLPWVKEFNKFDLYTKSTEMPDVEELKPYYQSLISKYCPGDLQW